MNALEIVGNAVGNKRRKNRRSKPAATLKTIQLHFSATAGGCFGLRSHYLNQSLHRGSMVWLNFIKPWQEEWAQFLGYPNFDSLPIGEREMVRLWVADKLLVSFYIPRQDVSDSVKEIRAAMNSLARLTERLHSMKREKVVPSLAEYLAERARESERAADRLGGLILGEKGEQVP